MNHDLFESLRGSKSPMLTPARALGTVDQVQVDEQALSSFVSGNAHRIVALDINENESA
jgi:hypothetical protein